MNKTEYLKSVEAQLLEVFKQVQIGNRPDKQKYRTEGFMQAGRVLGIVNEAELTELMEKTHKDVFAMTIAEREQKKLELEKQLEKDNYAYLDVPTFVRDMLKKQSESH